MRRLSLINNIIALFQKCNGPFHSVFFIKFDFQNALLEFAVVDDADVLDAQLVGCQDRGDGAIPPASFDQIAVELVHGGQDARLIESADCPGSLSPTEIPPAGFRCRHLPVPFGRSAAFPDRDPEDAEFPAGWSGRCSAT